MYYDINEGAGVEYGSFCVRGGVRYKFLAFVGGIGVG